MSDIYSLYRLLNGVSCPSTASAGHHECPARRAFSPKFDIYENEKEFVLEGELPGLSDKSKVHAEFSDAQTLIVKGRIERSYKSSASEEKPSSTESSAPSSPRSLKPTVEDEIDEADTASISEVSKKLEQKPVVKAKGGKDSRPKYWLSERTVGDFERSFTFPAGIDQDGVSATFEHGVLSIRVPKRTSLVGRRIYIQ